MKKIYGILAAMLMAFTVVASTAVMTTAVEREDGTALGLSEIQGHNIYCGVAPGEYTITQFYPGAALPTTEADLSTMNLPNGTNYCAATTVDIDNRESIYSNEFVAEVNIKSNPKPPTIPVGTVIQITGSR